MLAKPSTMFQRVRGLPLDLVVLLTVSVPALIPLLATGFVHGHDSDDPPWRSLALARSLWEGVLYPRWSSDLY